MPEPDKFALVTGASGGLGKAFSAECARYGFHLILVDLPGTCLQHLGNFLSANYGVRTFCIETDLTSMEGCLHLRDLLIKKQISITVLINNAGVGGTHFFDEKDIYYYSKQIQLNAVVPTILSRIFLNDLKCAAHDTFILNVASLAGYFPLAGKQVYGATKSYLLSFSKSLRKELLRYRVHVTVLCPGGVNSNLQMILKHQGCSRLSQMSIMQPDQVAAIGLRGLFARKEVVIPGKWNKLSLWLSRIVPSRLQDRFSEKQMKVMMSDPSSRLA